MDKETLLDTIYVSSSDNPFDYVWGWDGAALMTWFIQNPVPMTDPGTRMLEYALGEKPILDTLDDLAGQSVNIILKTLRGYAYGDDSVDYGDITFLGIPEIAPDIYNPTDNQFSGNSTTPLAAMAHYIFGDGEKMNVDLKKAIPFINMENIQPLDNVISNASSTSKHI